MTDKSDMTTGDKIIKAREDERRRITQARPMLTTKLGFDGIGSQNLPTMEIKIVGGDPEALTKLGLDLQARVIEAMPSLVIEEKTQ